VPRTARDPLPARLARVALTLVSVLSIGLVVAAPGNHYPAKPIRPFVTGGPNDISARMICDTLGKSLQHPVVVENRPGAASSIGVEAAAPIGAGWPRPVLGPGRDPRH
jgi:tripartite-type tricarboxylate transporter receptor subunit TctC